MWPRARAARLSRLSAKQQLIEAREELAAPQTCHTGKLSCRFIGGVLRQERLPSGTLSLGSVARKHLRTSCFCEFIYPFFKTFD